MRQGEDQTFACYVNNFEYMPAIAKGFNREGRGKINRLNEDLNSRLTDLLMQVSLSLSDT